MKFRFSVERLVLPNNQNIAACAGTTIKMMDVQMNVWVNGVKVIETLDLENNGNSIVTPVTIGALSVGVTTENSEAVAVLEIAGLELWESADVKVEIIKTGYNTYTNTFKAFGYDLGNSPTQNNGDGDPIDYNPDIIIVMVPTFAGDTRATALYSGNVLMTAVIYGSSPNGLFITGNGIDDFQTLIAAFNIANPVNEVTGNPIYDLTVPLNGEVYTLSGGIDVNYRYPYARITGWTAPFTNEMYYYNLSSTVGVIEFLDETLKLVGLVNYAMVCCSTVPVKIKVTSYDVINDGCGCGSMEVFATCETAFILAKIYQLKPIVFANVACTECCETDGCVIVQGDNHVIVAIDPQYVDIMFVDDQSQIGSEEIDISYELYNSAGLIISTASAVYNYEDAVLPDWPVVLPRYGDYILLFKYGIVDVIECTVPYKFVGCNQYHIKQTTCNTFRVYNYSASKTNLFVKKLGKDNLFVTVQTISVDACSYVDVVVAEDGVYDFLIGVLGRQHLIVVVDCRIRQCYVDYMLALACKGKVACGCGGRCAGGCSAIPTNFYDFNAFMSLVYGYFSLLNEEYIDHYIYAAIIGDETDFGKEDLERLYDINQLLNRAIEYCGTCKSTKDNTGCLTCK
jgi:hypothetical protein